MKNLKWILLIIFVGVGLYYMTFALRGGYLFMAAWPQVATVEVIKATILLPISILFIAQGFLFFLILKKK